MIYCLTRTEPSKFYTRTGVKMKDIGATIQLRDGAELEQLIDEVEASSRQSISDTAILSALYTSWRLEWRGLLRMLCDYTTECRN